MVQQLTIFDAVPTTKAFEINDTVAVVVDVSENAINAVEDYYYLKDFEGLKGQIVKVLSELEYEVQYEVQFPKRERLGIFRQDELRRE